MKEQRDAELMLAFQGRRDYAAFEELGAGSYTNNGILLRDVSESSLGYTACRRTSFYNTDTYISADKPSQPEIAHQ